MKHRTYSDVQALGNQSGRWLVRILLGERLWTAQVCESQPEAKEWARAALARLDTLLLAAADMIHQPLCPQDMIDLDALDRGPGDDDAA